MSETEFGFPEGQGTIPLKKGAAALSSTEQALLMRREGVVPGGPPQNSDTDTIHKWFTGDDPNAAGSS